MSLVVIPALFAAEADAPRVECAPKNGGINPCILKVNRSHQATVLQVTALCDLMNEMNSFVSSWRRGAVHARYT